MERSAVVPSDVFLLYGCSSRGELTQAQAAALANFWIFSNRYGYCRMQLDSEHYEAFRQAKQPALQGWILPGFVRCPVLPCSFGQSAGLIVKIRWWWVWIEEAYVEGQSVPSRRLHRGSFLGWPPIADWSVVGHPPFSRCPSIHFSSRESVFTDWTIFA